MDPIDEPSGARKRLQHLGYGAGSDDEEIEVSDRLAILAFQQANGLKTTGTVDDATKEALTRAHDF